MARLLLLAALLPALAYAAPKVLIDTDFGTAATPVNDVSADGAKRITGVLPEGWNENSGWGKDAVITYERREEAGRAFLRVTKAGGPCQLSCHLPPVTEPVFCRLELTARSASHAALNAGIRDAGAPYSFHWSTPPELNDKWQDLSYEFRLERLPQTVGLWLNLESVSSYDLARVKLTTRAREDIIEELKARYPESGPRNLVRVTRFPLGLPTGWSLDREFSDGDQVVVKADAAAAGPSGYPSLSIRGDDPWRVWAAPVFIGRSFERHTASLFVRGEGKLRLSVFGDGRQLHGQDFSLPGGDKWQRLAVTFTPLLLGKLHQLRLEGQGQLWLDSLQVEHGQTASDFAPQSGPEVMLGVPPSAASAARIQFADEPAAIVYAVTGAPAGSALQLRLYDLYGGNKALPAVKLSGKKLQQGTVSFATSRAHPYGPFRIEAEVQDAAGKSLSPADETVVHRLPRPKYWGKLAPNSPFGTHTLSTTRHILMAKAVGANWTRLHDAGTEYIGWAHLEPEPGRWTFHDTELKRYVQHGMKILGLLSTSPLWANYQQTPQNGYFDRYVEPKDFSQFANYVRVVTKRYHGLIDTYDVWNEPWGTSFWSMGWDAEKKDFKRSPTAAEDYYRLQKLTYAAAKAVDPQVTILGFNSYASSTGRDWTAAGVKEQAYESCDAVCYHHYSTGANGFPGDDVDLGLRQALEPLVAKYGALRKPVWMTEGSGTTYLMNNGFYNHTACGQPLDDNFRLGDRFARYMVGLLIEGVSKLFPYTMHSQGAFSPAAAEWRVLVEDDGFLHPVGAAHAQVCRLLEDARFVRSLEVARGVYAHLFKAQAGTVAVLATKPEHAAYTLPNIAGAKVTDLFGNPLPARAAVGENLAYVEYAGTAAKLAELLK